MKPDLQLTPEGFFICPEEGELRRAFLRSQGEGFLALAFGPEEPDAAPLRRFCRETVRELLQEILRGGNTLLSDEASAGETLEYAPTPEEGEELTVEALLMIGREVRRALREAAGETEEEIRTWIASKNPEWKDIGRVTFHLAENRKDSDGRHPFVFLATYPDRTGKNGEVRHIPLASALKLYADDREQTARILAPLEKAARRAPFLDAMLRDRSLFKPCLWNAHDAFLFVRASDACREAGIPIRLNRDTKRPRKLTLNVSIDTAPRRPGMPLTDSILRFSVAAAAGDRILTQDELAAIMKTGGGLIRIKGEWIEADTEQISALLHRWEQAVSLADAADIPFFRGLRLLSGMDRAGGSVQGKRGILQVPDDPDQLCVFTPGPGLAGQLAGAAEETPPPLPPQIRLRPYQEQGVRWLFRMGRLGLGGCLADDMGLGKTVQVLTYLEMLRQEGSLSQGCALVVAPASLLRNWQAESAKFTPELRTGILHPSEGNVEDFRADPASFCAAFDLLVTSYGMVMRLVAELSALRFPVILLDEAQNIKNGACLQSGAARKLRGTRRFALTGTPVENSPADLWSIFDFLNPGLLGTFSDFRETLKGMQGGPHGGFDCSALRRLVRPFILRRLKTDRTVIRDLPAKTEVRTWCFLTDVQLRIYQRAVEQFRAELETADGEERRKGVILSYLMQFKQICNHPTQFTGLGEYSAERSGKFQRLAELAHDLARRSDRVLVFTQFREIILPLHDLLAEVFRRPGLMLHGGTPVAERARAVEAFQTPGGPPFFVLSLRAAGTGLNLTAANHVVHFDRWWNPAVENQATDRAFRIGQKRGVLVHKFVCRGTVEERIDALIAGKARTADGLLGGAPEKLLTEMTSDELLAFVRPDPSSITT